MSNQEVAGLTWKRYREDAGLSRVEAAEKLGIHPVTLSRYENAKRVPADVREKMSALYGQQAIKAIAAPSDETDPITAVMRAGQREQVLWVRRFVERVLEAQLASIRAKSDDEDFSDFEDDFYLRRQNDARSALESTRVVQERMEGVQEDSKGASRDAQHPPEKPE